MAFYNMTAHQHQYSSPFAVPHQHSSYGGIGGGYHPSPLVTGSPPSQMETSSYLPEYLLGGPPSPSPKSPQRSRHTPYFQSPQHRTTPMSVNMASAAQTNRYGSGRKHETKPGGPPVQSLHEHTTSPVRPHPPLIMRSVASPERRQLTFTASKSTVPHFSNAGSSLTQSPMPSSGMRHSDPSSTMHPSPPSPSQMDPFYTQGEELKSDDTYSEYWVTIFGFPPASSSFILEQFAQYGTIVNHKLSSEGNWMHLQYQTVLQAKKALSKNGRIFGDGIMVGVQPCIDKAVTGGTLPQSVIMTPQRSTPMKKPSTMRPLTAVYHASSSAHEVSPDNPHTPQKSSGFISRTLEYVFGW